MQNYFFRYQSIRRTITSRREDRPDASGGPPGAGGAPPSGGTAAASGASGASGVVASAVGIGAPFLPAVRLLIRHDFYTLLHANAVIIFNYFII